MSILKEIWHGNVCPQTDSRNNSPEMKELIEYMARHHDDLLKTMTDEQKEIFEKFDDCWSEYSSYAEEAIFTYAFKLGMQIAIETLLTSRIAAGYSFAVREKLFSHVMMLGKAETSKFSIPSLITRTTNDITQLQMIVVMGLQSLVKAPIMAVWAISNGIRSGCDLHNGSCYYVGLSASLP